MMMNTSNTLTVKGTITVVDEATKTLTIKLDDWKPELAEAADGRGALVCILPCESIDLVDVTEAFREGQFS